MQDSSSFTSQCMAFSIILYNLNPHAKIKIVFRSTILYRSESQGLKLIYSIDLNDSSQNCPANLLEATIQSAQACRQPAEFMFNPPDCDSVTVVIATDGV